MRMSLLRLVCGLGYLCPRPSANPNTDHEKLIGGDVLSK